MSAEEKDEKSVTFSFKTVVRFCQDVVVILAVILPVFGLLWGLTVSQPLATLNQRVDKLEQTLTVQRDQITSIDKNMAVLAEGMSAMRQYLINEKK